MRRIHTVRAPAVRVVLTFCVFLQAGCIGSSPPSRFYALSSVSSPGAVPGDARYNVVVVVSIVNFPGHLDRPQIVAQTGPNSLLLAEFDRWAEPLRDNFTRILLRNLGDLLAKESVLVTSWRARFKCEYRLVVDAQQFDIEPRGVVLAATWALLSDPDEEVVLTRRFVAREAVDADADDYTAKVAALSRTLGILSQDIATGITETLRQR
jgi:uncharacterized lipoprotein YmbA